MKIKENEIYKMSKGKRNSGKRQFNLRLLEKYYDEGYTIIVLKKKVNENKSC